MQQKPHIIYNVMRGDVTDVYMYTTVCHKLGKSTYATAVDDNVATNLEALSRSSMTNTVLSPR